MRGCCGASRGRECAAGSAGSSATRSAKTCSTPTACRVSSGQWSVAVPEIVARAFLNVLLVSQGSVELQWLKWLCVFWKGAIGLNLPPYGHRQLHWCRRTLQHCAWCPLKEGLILDFFTSVCWFWLIFCLLVWFFCFVCSLYSQLRLCICQHILHWSVGWVKRVWGWIFWHLFCPSCPGIAVRLLVPTISLCHCFKLFKATLGSCLGNRVPGFTLDYLYQQQPGKAFCLFNSRPAWLNHFRDLEVS